MSEEGWHGFLAALGVDDWVVLHGGATAVFRVGSLSEAARLAEAVAKAPEIAGAGVLLTLADTRVTVRLSRDIWNLEPRHVQLARRFGSCAGTRCGSRSCSRPGSADGHRGETRCDRRRFLRAVLGYAPMADDNAVDPLGHGSTVWMQELDQAKPLRHAMHIDVSVARERVQRVSRRRSLRAGVSSTSRMHHRTGRSPTARAIAFVSVHGQMGPGARPDRGGSRCFGGSGSWRKVSCVSCEIGKQTEPMRCRPSQPFNREVEYRSRGDLHSDGAVKR